MNEDTMLVIIERLAAECVRHGGFGHGKCGWLCDDCRTFLRRLLRLSF